MRTITPPTLWYNFDMLMDISSAVRLAFRAQRQDETIGHGLPGASQEGWQAVFFRGKIIFSFQQKCAETVHIRGVFYKKWIQRAFALSMIVSCKEEHP